MSDSGTESPPAAAPDRTMTTSSAKPGISDYKTMDNYDSGFLKTGKVTTITELVAKREAQQTDRLTLDSFSRPPKVKKLSQPFLFCSILRITVPSAKPNEPNYPAFKKNKFDKKATQRATYKKCILVADLNDGNQLTGVILEDTNEDHNRLFQRDLSMEFVQVGNLCAILSPKVEGHQLKNGAWVITTNRPLEFLKAPEFPTRLLRSERVGHEFRYFILKSKKVFLLDNDTIDPLKTKCNFHTCDRLNAATIGNGNCGCWVQNKRSDNGPRNTVLMFTFYFQDTNDKIQKVTDFSSLRTSKLFFENSNILSSADALQRNSVYNYMQDQWRNTVDYVNENGGWTMIGWFIRAEVDEDDKEEGDATLYRTNVKINISYLFPTTETKIPEEHLIKQSEIEQLIETEQNP